MRLQGLVWRALHPRWSFAPDSGAGAARFGGRFNRPGQPALYSSLRFETAWLEAQQGLPFKPQALTLCGYEVDCEDLVDLSDPDQRTRLGILEADLAAPWRALKARGEQPAGWRLADTLTGQGIAGILAPSFAPGAGPLDLNAVFWTWAPGPPHQVRVLDPDRRLPRNDLSWR